MLERYTSHTHGAMCTALMIMKVMSAIGSPQREGRNQPTPKVHVIRPLSFLRELQALQARDLQAPLTRISSCVSSGTVTCPGANRWLDPSASCSARPDAPRRLEVVPQLLSQQLLTSTSIGQGLCSFSTTEVLHGRGVCVL